MKTIFDGFHWPLDEDIYIEIERAELTVTEVEETGANKTIVTGTAVSGTKVELIPYNWHFALKFEDADVEVDWSAVFEHSLDERHGGGYAIQ